MITITYSDMMAYLVEDLLQRLANNLTLCNQVLQRVRANHIAQRRLVVMNTSQKEQKRRTWPRR